MPERRTHRRWARRVRVNFWRRDDPDTVLRGYTSDLSSSGAFVTTEKPLGRHGRLQMRISTGTGHYLLEGVVARSVKVHKDLAKVKPGGMGIRFLRVDELVGELLKTSAADLNTTPASLRPPEPVAKTAPDPGAFEVDLGSRERFLRLWEQDIRLGGLFVETDEPAPADSTVSLRLKAPGRGEPLQAHANVVQVFEPGQGLLTGMGVVLVDADELLGELQALADHLRAEA